MRLEAQNVSYAYRLNKPALRNVSMSINEGEVIYLLGSNGGGKTTLLACLAGIFTPTEGHVLINGEDIRHYSAGERARRVGLIPQLHVSAFAYSVREMVLMGRAPHLGLFGTPRRHDYEIADEALESVGITRFRDRMYTQLSGGERQLVMIARGLAQQCDTLLMDEPDAHLDPHNQIRILEVVAHLASKGLSFIISSHTPNHALMFANRILVIKKGRRLAFGSVEETLTEPLLSEAYDMDTEVIYEELNGIRRPRAIVPRRKPLRR